jgi:hypothetical protein
LAANAIRTNHTNSTSVSQGTQKIRLRSWINEEKRQQRESEEPSERMGFHVKSLRFHQNKQNPYIVPYQEYTIHRNRDRDTEGFRRKQIAKPTAKFSVLPPRG